MRAIRTPGNSFRLKLLAAAAGVPLAVACAQSAIPSSSFGTTGGGNDNGGTGSGSGNGFTGGGTGTFATGGNGGTGTLVLPGMDGGEGGPGGPCDGGPCADFPAGPTNDTNMPVADVNAAATAFGDPSNSTTTDGPCLVEPADGALFPYNWLRPRILWEPATKAQTQFEVRIHSDVEVNDYVVYTTANYWTLDKPTWQAIAGVPGANKGTLVGQQITVTVRALGASGGTPAKSNSASFIIAPAIADGSLIYWTTPTLNSTATTTLQGFHVGDEGVATALTPAQVQQQVWAGPPDGGNFPSPAVEEPVGCIGCHTSTPDGVYVGFTAQWPWPNAIASVQADGGAGVGTAPPWLTAAAIDNLGPNTNDSNYLGGTHVSSTNNVDNVMLGIQTFSPAHYATGDRIEITSIGAAKDQPSNEMVQASGVTSQLIWINLEFTGDADGGRPSAAPGAPNNGGWGLLSRTGDSNSAGAPNWSNDGTTIAYTSVNGGTMDGRLDQPTSGSADIYTIPYAGGKGGAAQPLQGANDPASNEYFPSFSPDDQLIAFNKVASSLTMYDQPAAEVYVVPAAGGTATPLKANQPVACTGLTSPGVQNTWPKWAPNPLDPTTGMPAPQVVDGNTYYWVTFSSTRSPTASGNQQLYVAGIVVDSAGNITDYAPIYLWNQNDQVNNLIPAWGEFAVPPPEMQPPPPPPPNPPR